MMQLIRISDGLFPRAYLDVRREYPDVSFPAEPDDTTLADFDHAIVHPTSPPEGDVVEPGAPELVDGVWHQGWTVRDFTVEEMAEQEAAATARKLNGIIEERARRLASGFDYDFGDARGVHRIGTTPEDHVGWNRVSELASAAIALGAPNTAIGIVTDTAPASITAMEWQSVLMAAGAWEQPIWQASFVLQAMDPIPDDYTNDAYWP